MNASMVSDGPDRQVARRKTGLQRLPELTLYKHNSPLRYLDTGRVPSAPRNLVLEIETIDS
jgi:hypothetical protein